MWFVSMCAFVLARECYCCLMRLCVFVRGVLCDVVWFGGLCVLSAWVFVFKWCVCALLAMYDVMLYGVVLWFVCVCACGVLVV